MSAEIKTFHAESSYVMDKGESIKDAQETAFNDAVKKISEEAVVVVKSSGSMKDNELSADEVETIAAAVLRIRSKTFGKKFTHEGSLEISAVVDAEVDTENVDKLLAELSTSHKADKNYEEFLADYTKRQEQFDTDAEISLPYIKRGHIYNLQSKNKLATADFEKAVALNNDNVGIHYAQAVLLEARGDKVQAAQEYRIFVKDAGIFFNQSALRRRKHFWQAANIQ